MEALDAPSWGLLSKVSVSCQLFFAREYAAAEVFMEQMLHGHAGHASCTLPTLKL